MGLTAELLNRCVTRRFVAAAPIDDEGALKNTDLVELDPLADRQHFVKHGKGERLRHQPDPRKHVPLREDQQRRQPGLLTAGGEKQREVKAGTQTGLQNVIGGTHFLTRGFKTGGGNTIRQAALGHRRKHCRHQLLHPPFVSALISGDPARLAPFRQNCGGATENPFTGRVVGQRKGRHHFGQHRQTGPFVPGQNVDGGRVRQRAGGTVQAQRHGDLHPLVPGHERFGRQDRINGRNRQNLSGAEVRDHRPPGQDHSRIRTQLEPQVRDGQIGPILNDQTADHRHVILLQGEVYTGKHLPGHLQRQRPERSVVCGRVGRCATAVAHGLFLRTVFGPPYHRRGHSRHACPRHIHPTAWGGCRDRA